MGRKALLVAFCWLTLSEVWGKSEKSVHKSVVQDNVSEESAPRLYRNVPLGVYASAAPYGSFSFQIPAFINSPKASASQLVPVKQEGIAVQSSNQFLRDSYGNKFVQPQSLAYKTTFPQQYVQLQDLPAHLAQPLLAVPANYQFKQSSPQYHFGAQYKLPNLQAVNSVPTFSYGGFAQPVVYAENYKSQAPSTTQVYGPPAQQQHHTSSKTVYTTQALQQQNLNNLPKYERLQEQLQTNHNDGNREITPQATHQDKAQLQAEPAKQTTVTAVVNGKKTTIKLDTKPPVPLLDLNLLEPLTFANPLVPQVQHFLPRINAATYHKLPQYNSHEVKNHEKEFVIQKIKSYDSGNIKDKTRSADAPAKKPKRPPIFNGNTQHKQAPVKPKITINAPPEITYEINAPNYKETYNEQVVSYNKETQMEPVHYTYGTHAQKEPVHYSYTHSSKEPIQIKEVRYESNGKDPKQLIYTFNSAEQNKEQNDGHKTPPSENESSENSGESSEESDDDGEPHHSQNTRSNHQEETPNHVHQIRPEHREEQYHHKSHSNEHHKPINHPPQQYYSEIIKVPIETLEPQFTPITNEFEENIRLLPTHAPHAALNLTPINYVQASKPHSSHVQPQMSHSLPASPNHHHQQHPLQQHNSPNGYGNAHPVILNAPAPHIVEKSKRIIIQEETPEEMHSRKEQMMAEIIKQEENNEEDFEKAYKEAAFGFPSYDRNNEEAIKDIYNPEAYGVPRHHSAYNIEHKPFQEYQEESDEFPKSSRLTYKDARDKVKEDYILDYTISKPESFADHYQKKAEYFKMYKKNKPERYFPAESENKNQEQNAKYTLDPTYFFNSAPKEKTKHFEQYSKTPQKYEYSYPKGATRDSSAYASRPHQRYKGKTQFVEPHFQYGFEPISLPRLLDSELAAMASNDSPESEKPGMRKKVYKENWYIKKTTTSGTQPDS